MTAAVINLPPAPRSIPIIDMRELRDAMMRGLFDNIVLAADQYRAGVTPISTLLEVIDHSRLYAEVATDATAAE